MDLIKHSESMSTKFKIMSHNFYHPVSGLVEQVVAKQLTYHIKNNKLDNPHQSAYKLYHSTETAL